MVVLCFVGCVGCELSNLNAIRRRDKLAKEARVQHLLGLRLGLGLGLGELRNLDDLGRRGQLAKERRIQHLGLGLGLGLRLGLGLGLGCSLRKKHAFST